MIKKFENYNKIDFDLISEVFAEFIDSGSDYDIHDSYFKDYRLHYFSIVIEIPNVRNEREWEKGYTIEDYLEKSTQQTEVLKDVNVCVKRIFDELGVLPKIYEDDHKDGKRWALQIIYEEKNKTKK